MEKPTLGRIIHIRTKETQTPEWLAAIVTLCREDSFSVQVFPDPHGDADDFNVDKDGEDEGYDYEDAGNLWRWPPRAEK